MGSVGREETNREITPEKDKRAKGEEAKEVPALNRKVVSDGLATAKQGAVWWTDNSPGNDVLGVCYPFWQ